MSVVRSLISKCAGLALVVAVPVAQGKWQPPVELGISCTTMCCSTPAGLSEDEIAHIVLIPVGEHAGSLLLWTRCDLGQAPGDKYRSFIWNPSAGIVSEVECPL